MHLRSGHRRTGVGILLGFALACPGCGAASGEPRASGGSSPARGGTQASGAPAHPSSAGVASTFAADFSVREVGAPLNVFGAQNGNRRATGGAKGLWLEILAAEKAWDAVGVRTAKVTVTGDFDLRGAFRDFGSSGNASTKLLVVDAATTRGEAAYVERLRIDGKELYKFGGEIEGSLENWGFVEASGRAAELRLTRQGAELHAYQRATASDGWIEFAPPQPVPSSMPGVVKVGVKLSAEAARAAEVTWTKLVVEGNLTRLP